MILPEIKDSVKKPVGEALDQEILIHYRKKIVLMEKEVIRVKDENAGLQRNIEALTTLLKQKSRDRKPSVKQELPKIKVQTVIEKDTRAEEELGKIKQELRKTKESENLLRGEVGNYKRKLDQAESGFNLRFDRSQKKVDQLERELKKKEGENASLKGKMEEMKNSFGSKINELIGKIKANQGNSDEILKKDRDLTEIKDKLKEVENENKEKTDKILEQQGLLNELNKQVRELKSTLNTEKTEKEEKIQKLERLLLKEQDERTRISNQLALMRSEESERLLREESRREKESSESNKMHSLKSEIDKLKAEITKCKKEAERDREESALAMKLLEEQRTRSREFQAKLKQKQREIEELEVKNESIKQEIKETIRKLTQQEISNSAKNLKNREKQGEDAEKAKEEIEKLEILLNNTEIKLKAEISLLEKNLSQTEDKIAFMLKLRGERAIYHLDQFEIKGKKEGTNLKLRVMELEKKMQVKRKKWKTKKEQNSKLLLEKDDKVREAAEKERLAEQRVEMAIESIKKVEAFSRKLKSSLESIRHYMETMGYLVRCYYCASTAEVFADRCGHSFCGRCVEQTVECPDCKTTVGEKVVKNKSLAALAAKVALLENIQKDIQSAVKDIDKELEGHY